MIKYSVPVAYESITVGTTAIGCTAATIQNSGDPVQKAFFSCETYDVRFRIDGTDPTKTEGHLLLVGQTLTLQNYDQIRKFKAINKTDGSSGVLKVTYYTDTTFEG